MTSLERHSISLFKFMLGFYPISIQKAFSEEMQNVFSVRCNAAAQISTRALLGVVFREILDFPGVVIRAHIDQLRTGVIKGDQQRFAFISINRSHEEEAMMKDSFGVTTNAIRLITDGLLKSGIARSKRL